VTGRRVVAFIVFVLLSGCMPGHGGFNVVQPTQPRDNPNATNQGSVEEVEPVYLDTVRASVTGKHSTSVIVGVTASNSCAKVTGYSVHRQGDGINISLDVWEAFHVGYKCSRSHESRLKHVVKLPFALREGRPYTFQIIVNGKSLGVVETYPRGASREHYEGEDHHD